MSFPIVSRIWPYISAYAKTLLAAGDAAAARTILGVSGGGSSSPQLPAWTYTAGAIGEGLFTTNNASIGSTTSIVISAIGFSGFGDWLGDFLQPGAVAVFCDAAGVFSSFTVAGKSFAGTELTLTVAIISAGVGGNPSWSGLYTLSFIPIAQTATDIGLGNVPNVDATNAANISSGTMPDGRFPATLPAVSGASLTGITPGQVGAATAAQGATADTAIQPGNSGLVPADTGWTANASAGDKTVSVANYTPGIDGTMQTALNVVSAGLGDALVADETQIAALTKKVQAMEAAFANALRPNA